MRSIQGPLRVWIWYSHAPALGLQVIFVAATRGCGELRALRTRLRLPEPEAITRLHPCAPGYPEAAAAPRQALWMPLEQFAAGGQVWLHEQQLAAARLQCSFSHADPKPDGPSILRYGSVRSTVEPGDRGIADTAHDDRGLG